jgi:predicted DNA-binding transcriptional regulator YafY
MQRTERLQEMMRKLEKGRKLSVADCCERFEVKRSTVIHDAGYLREKCYPDLYYDRFKDSYVVPDPKKSLPEFELSEGELLIIALGNAMLSRFTSTSFEPLLTGAIDKITRRVTCKVRDSAADIACIAVFPPGGVLVKGVSYRMYLDLFKAIRKTLSVDIKYFTARNRRTAERRIDPYRLLYWDGAWYVTGYCHKEKELRTFALHRIQEYVLSGDIFKPMDVDKLDKFMKSPFQIHYGDGDQPVKILFQPNLAVYIKERRWHDTEKKKSHEDGSCTLSLTAQSLAEIKRWVLEKGADAEVIEPPELREMLRQELEKALAQYN